MSGEVNILFILDMQRKLYRWSNEDPDNVFVDLFNLVCDRRTLNEAWRRLARNSGLRIPTLIDRLVQMALKLILEPIFEADF